LRQLGKEYGATTQRPRRCGWFDAVALRYAVWLNGLTALAVTKLDVLDSFDRILLCTAYRLGDQLVTDMPDTIAQDKVEPVYEEWQGWKTSTREARAWNALPSGAQAYLRRIQELAGIPIRFVSVGPHREQIICL
jgi:adenylosuccinate synthase